MVDKDPTTYSLLTYGYVFGLAALGGFASFWTKVKRGEVPKAMLMHLIGEITTSILAGVVTFYLCEWAEFPKVLGAALIGMAGHMGTRALTLGEDYLMRKYTEVRGGPTDGATQLYEDKP